MEQKISTNAFLSEELRFILENNPDNYLATAGLLEKARTSSLQEAYREAELAIKANSGDPDNPIHLKSLKEARNF